MVETKKSVVENGKRIKGQTFLVRHLDGETLTRNQAIMAKCYDCMGFYTDGPQDCGITTCPLYRFMPFRGEPDGSDKAGNTEEDLDGPTN